MKKRISVLTFSALAVLALPVVSAHASDAAKTGNSAKAGDAAAAPSFEAKTKSVFPGSDKDHNPFWPVGWVKTEETTSDSPAASILVPKASDFNVSTILLNEPPMAVINGKEMAEGEVQNLDLGAGPVTVQLMAVQDGRVIIRWQNQTITVPLHRDEAFSKGDAANGQAVDR